MKQIITFLFVLSGLTIYSQEVIISAGTNFTDYSFASPANGAEENFSASGSGNYLEVGYSKKLGNKTQKSMSYSISVNLNEYNANSGNLANSYSWETSYLGLRNGLIIPVFSMDNGLELDLGMGVNVGAIVHGQQNVNGMVYDIADHQEFSGLTAWGDIGLNLKFDFKEDVKIAIGYSMAENYSLSGKDIWHNIFYSEEAIENVKFNSSSIKLSLIYLLN